MPIDFNKILNDARNQAGLTDKPETILYEKITLDNCVELRKMVELMSSEGFDMTLLQKNIENCVVKENKGLTEEEGHAIKGEIVVKYKERLIHELFHQASNDYDLDKRGLRSIKGGGTAFNEGVTDYLCTLTIDGYMPVYDYETKVVRSLVDTYGLELLGYYFKGDLRGFLISFGQNLSDIKILMRYLDLYQAEAKKMQDDDIYGTQKGSPERLASIISIINKVLENLDIDPEFMPSL